MDPSRDSVPWSFFSRYGHVLLYIHRNPRVRMRDISAGLGLTERTVQKIILKLEKAGTVVRHREGRNNIYQINYEAVPPHPSEDALDLEPLLLLALKSFEKD